MAVCTVEGDQSHEDCSSRGPSAGDQSLIVPSFELPDFLSKSSEEQVDLLLLAWILLLQRGSIDGVGDAFCWVIKDSEQDQKPSSSILRVAHVTDIISDGQQMISEILLRVQNLRRTVRDIPYHQRHVLLLGVSSISKVSTENLNEEVAGHGAISTSTSLEDFTALALEIRQDGQTLRILPFGLFSNLSTDMAQCQTRGFVDILNDILKHPHTTVEGVLQVGEHELSQIWRWNSPLPPTIKRGIHDIVAEKMLEHPEKQAVSSWDGGLTYGELDKLSSRLSQYLTGLGIGLGSNIPLCFEKSKWTIVGLLGVMRTGATFVLTDPSQPEARLTTIVEEVEAKVVVTSKKQVELGTRIAPKAKVIAVDNDLFEHIPHASQSFGEVVPSSAVMYIIFTSGSTGKPKGVVISHENFTTGALPRGEAVGYKPHSRVLDFPSYAFDVSLDCMLCTLAQGGCICVPSEEQRVNDLSGAIRSMNVNMAHMTPSVARLLAPDALAMLEVLGLGGESLSSGDASTWSKVTKLIIAYGPSECTVGCTINNNIDPQRSYTSIGKGTGGITWIVDPEDHNILTPIGGVGELLVEGGLVGVGYLNQPEKTSEVFIEDPIWLNRGCVDFPGRHGRLYKTGDLVKYDPDGSGAIVFVGRKDRQVKLRGQRVELAEIEHHMRTKLPGDISLAVEVITPGGKSHEPTLVAFISEHKDKQPLVNDGQPLSFSSELQVQLRDMDKYLVKVLPRYMVPTAHIPLPVLPLLVSCKVDRKKLHEIGLSMTLQQMSAYRTKIRDNFEPTTEHQRVLQRIWRQILGQDLEIGTKDNFFALGGDSLKAMKLVAAARSEGLLLTVSKIFESSTLSAMAAAIVHISEISELDIPKFSLIPKDWTKEAAQKEVAGLCKLQKSDVEDTYPCTPLQEGLMALSAKVEDAYIAQRVVKLPSIGTAERLIAAFEVVSSSCSILRTRVVQVPGRGLMQVVVKSALPLCRSKNLKEYLQEDRGKPMALGDALARFGLVACEADSNVYLILTIHHALYDGWSMPAIIHRVNKAYKNVKIQQPTPFTAFIKYLHSADTAASADYWREELVGATGQQFPILPFAGYRPQADSLLEQRTQLSRASSSTTTVAIAVRAAWALVAARYTSCINPVFGETLTGRNAPVIGIGEIEGPVITTVPLRARIDLKLSVSEFLQSIQSQTVLRIPHEHLGLQHIRRLSPDAREACELRTGIVLHPNTVDDQMEPRSVEDYPADGFTPADDLEAAREALKFNSYALMLVCSLDTKGFDTMASFDSKTVDSEQMQQILIEFGRTVQELCSEASKPLSSLNIFKSRTRVELQLLSSLGIASLSRSAIASLEGAQEKVKACWIVDPIDLNNLLPAGAAGELLIESLHDLSLERIPLPSWLSEGNERNPGEEARCYRTRLLAKYNSDGSVVLVEKKAEKSIPVDNAESTTKAKEQVLSLEGKSLQLRSLWSRILHIQEAEISATASFFELGGDSIGVMKLVSEGRMEGLELTVAQVFEHHQLSQMAEICKERATAPQPSKLTTSPFSALETSNMDQFISDKIRPLLAQPDWHIVDILPARPLQDIAVKGTTNLPRYSARYEAFYFQGRVDRERLFTCAQQLVDCHEILRSVFVRNAETCLAVVVKDLKAPTAEYDIDGDVKTFVHKLCDLDINTKMPLGSSFVKFFFVQGTDGQSSFVLKISHAQYDEICLPRLLHEFAALYEGRQVQNSLPFSSYVYHLLQDGIPKSISYWRILLQGSSLTVLRPDIALDSRKIGAINKTFSIAARNKQTTVATLPTAAWALCLARRLSLRDVVFGEVVSGRNIGFANADRVMGPTWQYVPVRVKFEDNWTAQDLLQFVQQQHINSSEFEGMGLKEIVKDCTDWDQSIDWFDSVVHQDVVHVESLPFLEAESRMETIYPHLEPLREWKIQAFLDGDSMMLEIITFDAWLDYAKTLLDDLGKCFELLVNEPGNRLFPTLQNEDADSGKTVLGKDQTANDVAQEPFGEGQLHKRVSSSVNSAFESETTRNSDVADSDTASFASMQQTDTIETKSDNTLQDDSTAVDARLEAWLDAKLNARLDAWLETKLESKLRRMCS